MPRMPRDGLYCPCAIGEKHFHPQRNPRGDQQATFVELGGVLPPSSRIDNMAWP